MITVLKTGYSKQLTINNKIGDLSLLPAYHRRFPLQYHTCWPVFLHTEIAGRRRYTGWRGWRGTRLLLGWGRGKGDGLTRFKSTCLKKRMLYMCYLNKYISYMVGNCRINMHYLDLLSFLLFQDIMWYNVIWCGKRNAATEKRHTTTRSWYIRFYTD